jgi:DNA-binding Lrp family transcriptional regulator
MKAELTQVQKELLLLLEKNSRVGIKELSLLLGIEELQAANEIAMLEAEGVICGYHTLVNWENTSLERVTALIEVRVTPQRGQGFDMIAERIFKYAEVQSVYLISGGYDLMVILEEKSLKEVASFVSDKLSTLDSVLSTATHFILKKYKDFGTVLTKKYEDEREKITP